MDPRKLAAAIIKACNGLVEDVEELMSEDKDEGKDSGKEGSSRSTSRSSESSGKSGRSSRGKKDDDDEPSEDDVVKKAREALKVLDSAEVKKILKKHGKAERASEVEPEHRQAAIDALDEAIEEAD